jgi:Protein of unknown function (DUF1592)/Protein of unknown function (DUF1588)/Protein of unknown function (DUF1595)/Protein of unknown function (DUF1587)/Protein of unknown function (DUF1585)
MKAGHDTKLLPLRGLVACGFAAALGLGACNGDIGGGGVGSGGGTNGGNAGVNGGAGFGMQTGGIPGGGGMMATGNPPGGSTGTNTGPLDSGRVSIHRLNNLEYDNTIRDLVGVTGNIAQTTFQPDEKGEFDNTADAFTINDARYEQYFNTADSIGEMIFASAALKAKILTCAPTAATDACTRNIINGFGGRAWRRPLLTAESDRLVALAGEAVTIGETPENAVKHVVKSILASPQFLYRIEFDSNAASLTAHSLTPYELASRLSYLGWSSMPDDALFALAASGQIVNDTVIAGQIDRMLADPKGASFTESFAGQWLGARDLKGHQVEPTAFPKFDEPLRQAMIAEELAYFNEFLIGTLPMTAFFTTDINFVNARLATHYGVAAPAGGAMTKIANTADTRVGFLGLASFQTFTSFSYRTAPTLRGKWVLLNLLCQTIPPVPAGVPTLDPAGAAADPALQSQNVRVRLAAHRTMATCAACHATLDPIGLGLENFDAIGAYRQKYGVNGTGDAIDSSGVLPSGEMFSTVSQLATALSTGTKVTQLTNCASEKMMTYALSRSLADSDTPYLTQIRAKWATEGFGLKALLKDIVLNDTFKFRRGEM